MQIFVNDHNLRDRLLHFALASNQILHLELGEEAERDAISTLADIVIETLQSESELILRQEPEDTEPLGYSVRNIGTKTLPLAEIYATPEEAQAWINTIYPDRLNSLEVVEIKEVTS